MQITYFTRKNCTWFGSLVRPENIVEPDMVSFENATVTNFKSIKKCICFIMESFYEIEYCV